MHVSSGLPAATLLAACLCCQEGLGCNLGIQADYEDAALEVVRYYPHLVPRLKCGRNANSILAAPRTRHYMGIVAHNLQSCINGFDRTTNEQHPENFKTLLKTIVKFTFLDLGTAGEQQPNNNRKLRNFTGGDMHANVDLVAQPVWGRSATIDLGLGTG